MSRVHHSSERYPQKASICLSGRGLLAASTPLVTACSFGQTDRALNRLTEGLPN